MSEVRMEIVADNSDAKKKLEETKKKTEELAKGSSDTETTETTELSTAEKVASIKQASNTETKRAAQEELRTAEKQISTEQKANDKRLAVQKQIATMAIGYAGSLIGGTIGAGIAMKEGQATLGNKLSTIATHVGTAGFTGAGIGTIVPGLGTAIGAIAGIITGLSTAAYSVATGGQRAQNDSLRALQGAQSLDAASTLEKRRDVAFNRELSMLSQTEKISSIQERINTIEKGSGDNSVATLKQDIFSIIKAQKTDLPEYAIKMQLYQQQLARSSGFQMQLDSVKLQGAPELLHGGSMSDSLSQIGGYVGAQVDIDTTNQSILSLLKEWHAESRRLAAESVDINTHTSNFITWGKAL